MTSGCRSGRSTARLLLPALLLGLASCAYYNTFYLAKKNFHLAEESVAKSETEKAPSDAIRSYETAITQSKKVLFRHPKSRWADDAVYLMGASYYGKGDYDSSLLSIQLLVSRFPKTPFKADALFLSGMCHTKQRDYGQAVAFFDSVLATYPRYEKRDQILYTMGNIAADRRDRKVAIREYERIVREFPKSRLVAPALHKIGELHFQAGRFDSSSAAYGTLLSLSKEAKDRIDAGVLQSQALLRLGKAEESLALLRDLEPPEAAAPAPAATTQYNREDRSGEQAPAPQPVSQELGDQIARLRLGEAAALNKLGRHQEAQELLQDIVKRFGQSNYAVEAQFQIGYTYETLIDSLEAARAAYDKAAQLPGRSVFKDQAVSRSKALQAQIDLEKRAVSGDAETEQRAAAALRVAEILLLDRELVDEATARYKEVERDYPGSRAAPRAAYALSYIKWKEGGDSLGAQEDFRDLVRRYPASTQARGAIALLASQGADTAGLGGLLTAVIPDTVAVEETLAAPVDSLAARPDTTAGPPLPTLRPEEGGAGPPEADTLRAPGGEPGGTGQRGIRTPARRRRLPEEQTPGEMGPEPPEERRPDGTDGQLPPPPEPSGGEATGRPQPPAGPPMGPPAPGEPDGQLPPIPPPSPPEEAGKGLQKLPPGPQVGPPAPGESEGQLPPVPPPEKPSEDTDRSKGEATPGPQVPGTPGGQPPSSAPPPGGRP